MAIAILVRREFSPAPSQVTRRSARELSASEWQAVRLAARLPTSDAATSTLVEFVDVECPYCRAYASTLQAVSAKFSERLTVGLAHLPLPIHRFSRLGAAALECARDQGKLPEMLNLLLQRQDSIGLKSWSSFASEAGIANLGSFETCRSASESPSAVLAGSAIAAEIGVAGTPGIVLDGWLFMSPPSERQLITVLGRRIQGATMREALDEAGVPWSTLETNQE